MILSIRTDKPEAEIGLFTKESEQIAYVTWYAHRELADTLLAKIRDLLIANAASFKDITGVVVFRGPGSFTGLRIGVTVANAFAYGNDIPVVGAIGDDWKQAALAEITNGVNHKIILPEYGREANITKSKK